MNRFFSLLHLSLVPLRQPKFETFRGSREEWLRLTLREPFTFLGHGGRELHWVPKHGDEGLIFGLIQGKKAHSYHEPPSHGGLEVEGDFWQGAYLFLDPTHHDDGQKLAIENDVLGLPRSLAKALFNHINQNDDAPYVAKAELIFDENDFWSFSESNGHKLKFIKFRFVVPNMWGPQNDLEEDLEETGKETGSEEVEVTFLARKGVSTQNEKVRTGVHYAARGAGTIKAKGLDNTNFSSAAKATTVTLTEEELEESSEQNLSTIARRVLKRG